MVIHWQNCSISDVWNLAFLESFWGTNVVHFLCTIDEWLLAPRCPNMAHSARKDSPELPDLSFLKSLARDHLIEQLRKVRFSVSVCFHSGRNKWFAKECYESMSTPMYKNNKTHLGIYMLCKNIFLFKNLHLVMRRVEKNISVIWQHCVQLWNKVLITVQEVMW